MTHPAFDRDDVLAALRATHGNIGRAARALGCSRRTLQNRMREFGIPRGKSGHPKRRLRYARHSGLVTVGLVGAAVIGGAALLRKRTGV